MKTITVKVLRAFYSADRICNVGDIVDLPERFAKELLMVKRVTTDFDPLPPVTEPVTAQEATQPEKAATSKKKEVKTDATK